MKNIFYLDLNDTYTSHILLQVLQKYQNSLQVIQNPPSFDYESNYNSIDPQSTAFYWLEYESLPFENLFKDSKNFQNTKAQNTAGISCAYCIRKGLIRKAQMSLSINMFAAKNPNSIVNTGVPKTWILELDSPEYLDESLEDCCELKQLLENVENPKRFILKPSLTGKGTGIHIFDSYDSLLQILETEFEEDSDDSESEEEAEVDWSKGYGSAISQIREWVVQEYIDNPLLLSAYGNRKFHIRTYVLAIGGIKVFVFREMLALFASKKYDSNFDNLKDVYSHITNTYVQSKDSDFDEDQVVHLFWDLSNNNKQTELGTSVSTEDLEHIYTQIKSLTADVFHASVSQPTMFQVWENCFELFGLDFMVDDKLNVFFLEANAYPDFKQTGDRLNSLVFNFFDSVVNTLTNHFIEKNDNDVNGLDLVFQKKCFSQ
ncbi:hypothetical protein BB558_000991 [Smittium angustum]|uniref:Tubulin-tyrosine ligase n=1 Tax=Smittium angustum TaxID=133377 RepID=A0A2U1JD08_SMIAN|nr:hypothetical protein BB558_000991 [Smittium angustum]